MIGKNEEGGIDIFASSVKLRYHSQAVVGRGKEVALCETDR